MIINVIESMARLEEIKNNAGEIDKKLQEIEQLFQKLEAPADAKNAEEEKPYERVPNPK